MPRTPRRYWLHVRMSGTELLAVRLASSRVLRDGRRVPVSRWARDVLLSATDRLLQRDPEPG